MFEDAFLAHSIEVFKQISDLWLKEESCLTYLTNCYNVDVINGFGAKGQFQIEEDNANFWLDSKSKEQHKKNYVTYLYSQPAKKVMSIKKDLIELLMNEDFNKLKLLNYVHHYDPEQLKAIEKQFRAFLRQETKALVNETEDGARDEKTYAESLMSLWQKVGNIIKISFTGLEAK